MWCPVEKDQEVLWKSLSSPLASPEGDKPENNCIDLCMVLSAFTRPIRPQVASGEV